MPFGTDLFFAFDTPNSRVGKTNSSPFLLVPFFALFCSQGDDEPALHDPARSGVGGEVSVKTAVTGRFPSSVTG